MKESFLIRRMVAALFSFFAMAWVGDVGAGAWTQPKGEAWVKVAAIYQFADQFYANDPAVLPDGTVINPGDSRPYDEDGSSRQRVLWLEAEYGVTDRWTLGFQAPWKDLRFEDRVQVTQSQGWGDVRAVSRFALFDGAHRLTIRNMVKFPTGRFSTATGQIPIGENQSDIETTLQWGHSLGRALSWAGVEFGYRLRLEDRELDFDPGDEWIWSAEAGWGLDSQGRVGLKANWHGARGDDESLNFFAPGAALSRNFNQVDLTLMIDLDEVFVEFAGGSGLGTEGYPASLIWTVGISRRLDLGSFFSSE
jgi:hypothetical protein